ncbi:DUF4878 domain-containing protein [Mycobacterium sp.]|uniref:Rv0361 family membrane protein n=1 Tax=Mycobacterium sp. TaxID=1785 RepID=UPI002C526144|nr:DUF4878 domain-containing protein [Mycobacterium sp.]HME49116.1 DUF4878 domain-containing protein [Mycobacterium sp.]
MSKPSGPDHDATDHDATDHDATDHDASGAAKAPVEEASSADPVTDGKPAEPAESAENTEPEPTGEEAETEELAVSDSEPTEVFSKPSPPRVDVAPNQRRYTAPSNFDAGSTEIMDTPPEPATEVFSAPTEPNAALAGPLRSATPQAIRPRPGAGRTAMYRYRSWGWVLALILVIAALAAVAIMGTVWLTQKAAPPMSQEDMVRLTIQDFDVAVQKGDLAALRGITCGTTRDNYVNYDDRAWADTHARVAAAGQYPVVASIEQVIVNGDHAEANVTSFMAYAPQTRSTRSFDLQHTDGQWKICQAPGS